VCVILRRNDEGSVAPDLLGENDIQRPVGRGQALAKPAHVRGHVLSHLEVRVGKLFGGKPVRH
jgi:hypothetical protein